MKNNNGFTFLELLAVLFIISVLGTMVIPIISNNEKKSKVAVHNYNVKSLMDNASLYAINEKVKEGKDILDNLVERNYIKEKPQFILGDACYKVKIQNDGSVLVLPRMADKEGNIIICEEFFKDTNNRAEATTANWLKGTLLNKSIIENSYHADGIDILYKLVESNNGYVGVGFSSSNYNNLLDGYSYQNKGEWDAVIVKCDQEFNFSNLRGFGGNNIDAFNNIIKDKQNNYICIGHSRSDLSEYNGGSVSKGDSDFLIAKYNENLDCIKVNLNGGEGYDELKEIVEIDDGYVCMGSGSNDLSHLSGGYDNGTKTISNLLVKYDFNFNIVKIAQFTSNKMKYVTKMFKDVDDNIICIGSVDEDMSEYNGGGENNGERDFLIVKFDKDLNLIKVRNIGGVDDDIFYNIIQNTEKEYICVGESGSDLSKYNGGSVNKGNIDFVIAKFDQNLNLIEINNSGGDRQERFEDLIQDNEGNYICIGTSMQNISVDEILNNDSNECLMIKFNSNFDMIKEMYSVKLHGSERFIYFKIIKSDSQGNYNIIGLSIENEDKFNCEFIKIDDKFDVIDSVSRGINHIDSNIFKYYLIKDKEVIYPSVIMENNSIETADFLIGKMIIDNLYYDDKNMLVSKEIDIGMMVSDIKIDVKSDNDEGTSYIFEVSTDGSKYNQIDGNKLDGKHKIKINKSDKIYYRIILNGTTNTSPKINSVKIVK